MILFKHAIKRSFLQPIVPFIVLLLPIAIIFIPPPGDGYPNGMYLYGLLSLFSAFLLCKPMAEERNNKIIVRISATPTSYFTYLSSHLLAYILTAFSMVIRWRFNIKPEYMLIDMIIILVISFFYPPSYLCLVIFAYYFAYKNKLLYMIPIIVVGIILNDVTYYLLLLQAFLFGTVLCQWSKDNAKNKELVDHQRRRTYELELVQSHLLADYQDTERMSRLAERQRIAEILHDNLGHELTAAHLSLKAYRTLLEANKLDQTQKTLEKVEEKLTYSLEQLKDSVKYIEPSYQTGFHDLTYIIDNYVYPINFTHSGNLLNLKPYIWQLILMSMKEALTNITKHASPKKITVNLEVTDYIVRILIENDGFKPNNSSVSGNGLRYMRSRLEAINGSLSIQKRDVFQLIIIIPIESGR